MISIGVNSENPTQFNDRLRTLNIFIWLCMLFLIPYYTWLLVIGHYNLAMSFILIQILYSASLVSNRNGYYNTSKLLILVTTNYAILILNFSFGHESGFHLYYFAAPLVIFTLFLFKQKIQIVLGLLLYLSSYAISEIFHNYGIQPLLKLEPSVSQVIYYQNIVLAFVFLIILALGFSKFHFRTYRELNEKNKELKTKQLELEILVKEKNTLLSETHHRVKNNLAVISGLFDLQMMFNDNPELAGILVNSKTRIKSMSLVHESLYQQQNLAQIDFKSYIENVVNEIDRSHNTNPNIHLELKVDDVSFDLQKAVPLGIIINEVMTNAYKHAFNKEATGKIIIQLSYDGTYKLSIQDNGKGFSPDLISASMGLTLIDALVNQLNGNFMFRNLNGTTFEMNFS